MEREERKKELDLTKDRTIPGTGCNHITHPNATPSILSGVMPYTLPLFAASIPQEVNKLEAKRPQVMTMNLIKAVKNFQRLMYRQVLCKLERAMKSMKVIIAFESDTKRHELSKESQHPQTRNNDGF